MHEAISYLQSVIKWSWSKRTEGWFDTLNSIFGYSNIVLSPSIGQSTGVGIGRWLNSGLTIYTLTKSSQPKRTKTNILFTSSNLYFFQILEPRTLNLGALLVFLFFSLPLYHSNNLWEGTVGWISKPDSVCAFSPSLMLPR